MSIATRAPKLLAGTSIYLGLASAAAVACFRFPALLTTPALREAYPVLAVRALIAVAMGVAFGAGLLAVVLGRRRGLAGMGLVAAAWLAGGTAVVLPARVDGDGAIALDWLVIDGVLITGLVLLGERLWPRVRARMRRTGWRVDATYFVLNHLLGPAFSTVFAGLAAELVAPGGWDVSRRVVERLPIAAQVLLLLVVTDLIQYGVHRTFHEVPRLWRMHAVHHSSGHVDALATSRNHILESLLTRALLMLPVFLLGFAVEAIAVYGGIVAVHATLLHSNLRIGPSWLEHVIVLPRYHHFHHSSEDEAIDTNYAAHFPWIDRIFGTHRLPAQGWPTSYGVVREAVPSGFFRQQWVPLVDDMRVRGSAARFRCRRRRRRWAELRAPGPSSLP